MFKYNQIKGYKMKIVKTLILTILAFLIIACSGFRNPISNETDDSIFMIQSEGSENGSKGSENGYVGSINFSGGSENG